MQQHTEAIVIRVQIAVVPVEPVDNGLERKAGMKAGCAWVEPLRR
ncbi:MULTISPECIES: hypothetical protein [Thiorhodovibrio]|nr:hypothetical protein [Thiorhodovibrio winogradskyi]WPL13570.1 hypothetical protein Thiosp_03377 [Thiorhodovibrio litoralis]